MVEEWKRVKPEVNKEYEEDKAWETFRDEWNVDITAFATEEELRDAIESRFNELPTEGVRGSFGKFEEEGRELVKGVAIEEWLREKPEEEEVPEETEEEIEERKAARRLERRVGKEPRAPKLEPVEAIKVPVPIEGPSVRVPKEKVIPERVYRPEEVERLEAIETPSGRMTRVVQTIESKVNEAAAPRTIGERVVATAKRARDVVADVLSGLAERIRRLGGR